MTNAVKAYAEKPRDQWLFDYPAQVSLCGTQIWWTSEVCKNCSVVFEKFLGCYLIHLTYNAQIVLI